MQVTGLVQELNSTAGLLPWPIDLKTIPCFQNSDYVISMPSAGYAVPYLEFTLWWTHANEIGLRLKKLVWVLRTYFFFLKLVCVLLGRFFHSFLFFCVLIGVLVNAFLFVPPPPFSSKDSLGSVYERCSTHIHCNSSTLILSYAKRSW